ncbi:hypothetical protein ABEF95_009767 [Exophiala dermatitidis]
MSLTFYHRRKDGTIKPVKMSIFDAFRIPETRSRRQPCPCCGKRHDPKHTPEASPKPAEVKEEAKKDDNAKEADDEIMLRMKAENASAQWKDILAATSYTDLKELKARWSEIKAKLPEFKKEMEEQKGKDESSKKAKDSDKEAIAAKKREEGLKRTQELKEKKEAEEKAKEDKRKAGNEFTDIQMWNDSYERRKWKLLASKHYDKTGERISAEQARKMVEDGEWPHKVPGSLGI